MSKVLVAYYSRTGLTEKMAGFIAEGVRFSGSEAEVKKIADVKDETDFDGYDGYIFGCPTYHKDMTNNFKTFLFKVQRMAVADKLGGAFGSSTHSGEAPKLIFDTMEFVFKMKMTRLGPFDLRENMVDSTEGMRACQDYGKVFGEQLGS